jgi:acyl-coenzyme A thioesterase PaaI-like protein
MDREMLDTIKAMTVADDTLPGRMGTKIMSASAAQVVATMPVDGSTQPHGLVHGGFSCVLAETIGALGAFLHASACPGGLRDGRPACGRPAKTPPAPDGRCP